MAKEKFIFDEDERKIEFIKKAIKGIRNARAEMNIVPSKKSQLIFVTEDESLKEVIIEGETKFKTLAGAEEIIFEKDKSKIGDDNISVVLEGCEVYLPLKDLVDYDKEIERLQKEKVKLEDEIKRVDSKLANKEFVLKAPASIVEKEKEKKEKYSGMLAKVLERLERFHK